MGVSRRTWIIGGAVVIAITAFVVLPSVGPLVLPDGRVVGFAGITVRPGGMRASFWPVDRPARSLGPIPVGSRRVAIWDVGEGSLLSGGVYLLRPVPSSTTSPAAYSARWTLWTRFTVDGKWVMRPEFEFAAASARHGSKTMVEVDHEGVLKSAALIRAK